MYSLTEEKCWKYETRMNQTLEVVFIWGKTIFCEGKQSSINKSW